MHLRHVGATTATTRIFNKAFLHWCQFSVDFLCRLRQSVDEVEVVFGEFVNCFYQEHSPFQGALDGIAAVRRLLPSLRVALTLRKFTCESGCVQELLTERRPLPVELVQIMASAACILRRVNLAGFLLVSFVALRCTSEAVGLKMSQGLLLPPRKHDHPCVTSFSNCTA